MIVVLERILTLDYFISKLCSLPLKKLSPSVLTCLRLGLYQIKYMDRVPNNAAVNETVNLAKKRCRSAVGMVNAVLRRACREDVALPTGNSSDDLSVRYSCKKWIVGELLQYLGLNDTLEFLESSLEAPPIYVRVNTTMISVPNFET